MREYRRASTTAIDASLKPLMQQHLREMETDLRAAGFSGELLIGTSGGGCQHVTEVAGRPVTMLKSGPAMAPVAGKAYITIEDLGRDAIVCDTGGTTFDVGLVRDGDLVYTRDSWLAGAGSATWWQCRRSTCAASAPAAARSPGSMPAACCASARRARARCPARPATAPAAISRP